MGKRVRREVIKEDRISNLPQDLRHQILYFLPTKEAAATALLSSSWRYVWLTLPWLRLGKEFFSGILQNHPELSHSHEQIVNFIDEIFQRRFNCRDHQYNKIMLKELQLHIPRLNLVDGDNIPKSTVCLLDKFLVWVVSEFQVKKIDYSIGYREDYYKCQPSRLHGGLANNFMSSTLASWKQQAEISNLTLRGCIINSCFETKWSTLRILSLHHVKLLDQQVLDSVTAHCRLLESLIMSNCSGDFDTLNALCLKRLVSLYICDPFNFFKKLQIDAPNLEVIHTYHGGNIESGRGSCIIHNLAISKNLKILKIQSNARISDEWLNRISIANLSKLKQFSVDGCHNVKRVRISSRSLDTIYLSCLGLEELKIVDAPRLLYLHFFYPHQSPPTPSFVLNGASASTKAKFWFQGYNDTQMKDVNYALEYEKLVKFLGVFNVLRRFKVIFNQIVVVPSDIRKMLSPPLAAKDQKIKYVVHFRKKHKNFNEVIDGLLWLSPRGPKTIIFKLCPYPYVSKTFEFEYKEDDDTLERCGYCKSLPVRCWRHCLHKVTIRNERLEKSRVSVKHDADIEEFFKTATDPREIVVKVIYCDFPLEKLVRLVSKH